MVRSVAVALRLLPSVYEEGCRLLNLVPALEHCWQYSCRCELAVLPGIAFVFDKRDLDSHRVGRNRPKLTLTAR